MKLEKAIELNKDSEKSLRSHKFIDNADALLLGIEALKRLILARASDHRLDELLLPGETEE